MEKFTIRKYMAGDQEFSFLRLKSRNVNIYMIISFLWRGQIYHFRLGGGWRGERENEKWTEESTRKGEELGVGGRGWLEKGERDIERGGEKYITRGRRFVNKGRDFQIGRGLKIHIPNAELIF